MIARWSSRAALGLVVFLVACSGGSSSEPKNNPSIDAGGDGATEDAPSGDDAATDAGTDVVAPDAAPDVATDAAVSCDEKAKACATTFGSLFTKSNGRADGTLVALVRPSDAQCTLPNSTHAVLQLSMQGVVQRLVANVDGVGILTKSASLIGPAYSEGWHENVTMEYATDLGVHSTDFSDVSMDDAVSFICDHLTLGAPVSVYAYSDGTEPSSAHQIHSNDGYPDGAIVVDPTSQNPTYLLFRFPTQVF